jgi:L-ascorbate metabolism protein UlaG (beta-lactamase superfamily)
MEFIPYLPQENSLDAFLNRDEDGSFYLGHAAVLVRINKKNYLIDAVYPRPLFLDSWLFFPELIVDRRLLSVEGVFISHCHEDHYDINFLKDLKPGTPIYITENRIGFEKIINDNFFNVIEIPPFEKYAINHDIDVLAIPSDHNNFDSSFVVKGKNFSVFQGNDNFLDEKSIRKARDIIGPVDHAYIPYSYVWWYPYCLASISDTIRKREAARLTENNMRIGLSMAEIFEASLVIPSAGNLVFYESVNSILNREIATPFDFLDYAHKINSSVGEKTLPLFSGDYALKHNMKSFIYTKNKTRDDFFIEMDIFLKGMQSKTLDNKEINLSNISILKIKEKLNKLNLQKYPFDIFFYPNNKNEISLKVSLRDFSLDIVKTPELYINSMQFSIEPSAFLSWINLQISFESILNSQRFLVYRSPEEFNRQIWDLLRNYF